MSRRNAATLVRFTKAMRFAAAALAVALTVASPALAYDYSPAAQAVLNQARAASGGNGWNTLRGWQEAGTWNGLPFQMNVDPVRYGVRLDITERQGISQYGYNGAGEWRISASGWPSGYSDRYSLGQGRTLAFFAAWGFYFPSRFAAKGVEIGSRQANGRSYRVLQIQPMGGGDKRELWFDSSTHLLSRTIDRSGPTPITIDYSDYRKVGPVKAPYRLNIDTGDGAKPQIIQIHAIAFRPADREQFSYPRQ